MKLTGSFTNFKGSGIEGFPNNGGSNVDPCKVFAKADDMSLYTSPTGKTHGMQDQMSSIDKMANDKRLIVDKG